MWKILWKQEWCYPKLDTCDENIVTGLSEKGAKAIYRYAYEQGHSCGYNEVASYITDLYELAEQILN